MKVCYALSACFLSLFFLGGCERGDEGLSTEANFEEWYPQYNRYIRNWLTKQVEEIEMEMEKLNAELADADDDEGKKKVQEVLIEKKKLYRRMQTRQAMGD